MIVGPTGSSTCIFPRRLYESKELFEQVREEYNNSLL